MNKRVLPLLLAVLMMLLAACTIRTVTDVKADGSGAFTMEFGFTDAELTSMEQFGVSSDTGVCSMSESMGADVPADITFEEVKRGDTTWCTYTKSFKNLDEMKAYFASEMEGMTVNRLEIKDGKFYYDITPGDTSSMSDTSGLPFTMDFSWIVKVPGTVGTNNATKVEGQTLTWDLLSSGLPDRFQAESSVGGGGLFGLDQTTLIIIAIAGGCCILGGLVIVVIVVIVFSRRKKAAQ